MTTADALLFEQGKQTCDDCGGANHPLSEMLRFRPSVGQWLCRECDPAVAKTTPGSGSLRKSESSDGKSSANTEGNTYE